MSISFPKCNQAGIEFVISTNEELQEESKFLSEEFPIAMYTQNFNHAASDSIPFHWHNELQITWISDGELEYCISGDKFRLRSDKLLLLQSHQLHSSRTTTCDVKTLCINFTPEIFHPLILKKYIQPMLDSHAFCLLPAVVKASSDYETEKIPELEARTPGILFCHELFIPGVQRNFKRI